MVSHDSLLGGATIALQYAARALNNNGYYVTFLVPEEGGIIQELERDDIHYIVDSTLYGSNEWMRYAGNYDIVYLSTVVLGKYISELIQYTQRIIWWVHEASEYYQKISLKDFDIYGIEGLRVYCGGSYAQKMFRQYFPEIETKVMLYGMPDYAKVKQNDHVNGKLTFLSIGTIEKEKDKIFWQMRYIIYQMMSVCSADLSLSVRMCRKMYIRKLQNCMKNTLNP